MCKIDSVKIVFFLNYALYTYKDIYITKVQCSSNKCDTLV